MDTTWVEIAGLTIRAPVTAGTSVLLGAQCLVYHRRLRTETSARSGWWSLFFLAMSVATFAGAPKHGFRHALSPEAFMAVLWVSSMFSGAAVFFAQCAALSSLRSLRPRGASGVEVGPTHRRAAAGRLGVFSGLQAMIYLGANVLWGPEMWLVVVNTAAGLIPVIALEAHAFRQGLVGGAWVAVGLGSALFTGVAYVGDLTLAPWFNHVDLAHVLMGVSFSLTLKGSGDRVGRPVLVAAQ